MDLSLYRSCRTSCTGIEPWIARNARWLLAIYWPILAIGTHTPQYELDPISLGDTGLDTPVHIACLALLTMLLLYVQPANRSPSRRLAWAVSVATVYAVIDEWTQGWFGRSVELGDLIANFIGIGLVAVVAWVQPPIVIDRDASSSQDQGLTQSQHGDDEKSDTEPKPPESDL